MAKADCIQELLRWGKGDLRVGQDPLWTQQGQEGSYSQSAGAGQWMENCQEEASGVRGNAG